VAMIHERLAVGMGRGAAGEEVVKGVQTRSRRT
jgi:hypothetical protein